MGFRTTFLMSVFISLAPIAAQAQSLIAMPTPMMQAKTVDQYPNFLEVAGTSDGIDPGSEYDLRCGLDYQGGAYVFNGFSDITFINQHTDAFARYQNIGGKLVVSSLFPQDAHRMLFEVIEPDHSIRAKNCRVDVENDAILQDCQPTTPFMSFDQTIKWPGLAAEACQAGFAQKGKDMIKTPPDPQQILIFQQELARRLSILEN